MGCDVPDIRLTVCIGEMGGIYKDINKFKQDTLELSQILGRGGRDGINAAFVPMPWAGQSGS